MPVQTGSVPVRSASDGPRVTGNPFAKRGTTMAGKPFPGAAAPFGKKTTSAAEGSPEEEAAESPAKEASEGDKPYSAADRKDMARKGHAMPDGSFPIKNHGDVRNAVAALPHASADKKAAAAKHIVKRARQIGAEQHLTPGVHAAAKG